MAANKRKKRRPEAITTETSIERSVAVAPSKPRLLNVLGPGLITGASDDDPSGIATYSQAGAQFGYAMGWYAADWLEGKSIPQTMDILPIALTNENIAQYEADLADPAAVFADQTRRDPYLRMYGNICYDTRDQYVNFPWSSEVR